VVAVDARLINAYYYLGPSVQLFGAMMHQASTYDEHMVKAINRIRGMSGFFALTPLLLLWRNVLIQ
jgi:hypothetical protein